LLKVLRLIALALCQIYFSVLGNHIPLIAVRTSLQIVG
jgi:hypothetical protein